MLHSVPAGVVSAAYSSSPTIETIRASTVYTWNSTISTTAQTIANHEASPADG